MNCIICGNTDFKKFMVKDDYPFFRCRKCRLEFIYPPPKPEILEEIYQQEYFDRWHQKEMDDAYIKQKKATFNFRLEHLPFDFAPAARILDCGCATGIFMELLKNSGFEPYGIDISEYAVNCCRQKFGNDRAVQGNLENAVFKIGNENIFDIIFMSDYLEHVHDPEVVIEKAYSLLKQRGSLVISTPNTGSFLKKILKKKWPHYKAEHLFYFSTENLKLLLSDKKFICNESSRSIKFISLKFLSQYFRAFSNPVFNFLFKCTDIFLPEKLKRKIFRFKMNEMTIICSKPS
jgi:2-polyprenyl-3-methyl-5-hydroxy-6-metoxy-1,4-benzoquinol methylase